MRFSLQFLLVKITKSNHPSNPFWDNQNPDIIITAYSPRNAVLDHAHTSLFLIHLSDSSANETTYYGTPTLSIPPFLTYVSRPARLMTAGVGLSLTKHSFSAVEICQEIAIIVTNKDGGFSKDVKRSKGIARIAAKKKEVAVVLIKQMIVDKEGR